MAVYAIGDIQGCHPELLRLLDRLNFDPAADHLWFAGDLVNRGPDSLAVMRLVKSLGERAICVLGNHDLHMLAVARGGQAPQKKDNFDDVLEAGDGSELLDWLRRQPLLHHDPQLDYAMVHAGLHPAWTLNQALTLAAEVESVLRGPDYRGLLANMYGNKPRNWSDSLHDIERQRFIVNCMTRMRYLDEADRLDLKHKGPPGSQPAGLRPWYASDRRRNAEVRLLFGHWSTHGDQALHNAIPLDSGCLWGGQLSALRLDGPPRFTRIDCPGARKPG